MTINYQRFIARDPAVCGGEPVVAGTRVTGRTVLASLAEGMSTDAIVADFPSLSREAMQSVNRVRSGARRREKPGQTVKQDKSKVKRPGAWKGLGPSSKSWNSEEANAAVEELFYGDAKPSEPASGKPQSPKRKTAAKR